MKRYLLIFIFLFGVLDVLLVSCCKDSIYDYSKINSIRIANTRIDFELADSASVNAEDFRILCELETEVIAVNSFNSAFINKAYAMKCINEGLRGLKSDITRFDILCNEDILGIPKGTSIPHEKMNVYRIGFYDDSKNTRKTINEWLSLLNDGGDEIGYLYPWYFEFRDTIVTSKPLKFEFQIEFQDSTIYTAETKHVTLI